MKHKQNGFSVLEILLVIVIIGAIAGIGFTVIRANNAAEDSLGNAENASTSAIKQNDQSTEASPAPTTASANPAEAGTFQIPELGIKLTVPADLNDLVYVTEKQTDPRGKEVLYARITSKSLQKLDAGCTPESSALGVIAKGLGEKPIEDTAPMYYSGETIFKTDTAFYTYGRSQASCFSGSGSDADVNPVNELQWKQTDLLKAAVKSTSAL